MTNKRYPESYAHAQKMRRRMTPAENALWQRLRDKQLGVKFRRQHVIGPFIVDFACLSHRLVIELDGAVHDDLWEYDGRRSDFIRQRGFEVIRFENDTVAEHLDLIVDVIMRKLASTSS